jgi:kynurenine formamidase
MGRFHDLSHTIEQGMVTYKGLPAPLICDFLSRDASRAVYAPGTEFLIGRLDMVGNTGTYLDSPFHRYAHGRDLSQLGLDDLADLDTLVVRADAARGKAIDASAFAGLDVRGRAVLVHTGWDRHWRTDRYFEDHPHLTEAAARSLADGGARLVGIDSTNIDGTKGTTRPVHTVLLGADIPIVEHLTALDGLPDTGARFFAVPPRISGFGTFPVRAFCTLPAAAPTPPPA